MLPTLKAQIEQGIANGLHLGAQVYVARHGRTIADLAIGEAAPDVTLTTEHLLPWFSAGKPITAIAIAQQWEAGQLDLDDPVATHIPEFAQHGKDAVTIRHLLTHTGGFRPEPYRFPEDNWETITAKLCAMRLEPRWIPGETAGYHAASSWWILAEIVQRLSGEAFSQYVRRHIFEPAGMRDAWLGMPAEQFDAYGNRWAMMYDTTKTPPQPRESSDKAQLIHPKPGSNACGPIRELGRFYEMLLNGGEINGQRILKPDTVECFTRAHRIGVLDRTFKQPITWGLGFLIDSKDHVNGMHAYGYGPHASAQTFGHSGMQSSTGFADPAHHLAVALIFNGTPGERAHQQRIQTVLRALYEDLR